MANKQKLKDLSCAHVLDQAIAVDWDETRGEDGEGYTFVEVETCNECGRPTFSQSGAEYEHTPDQIQAWEDADQPVCHHSGGFSEGPLMSSYWPCQIDDLEAAAVLLKDLPLVPVQFSDGKTGIALTGGGMDLSWEIARAYVRLGYLPPFDLRLPEMAGPGYASQEHRFVVSACRQSAIVLELWIKQRKRELQHTAEWQVKAGGAQSGGWWG